jgi:hypothetical protein
VTGLPLRGPQDDPSSLGQALRGRTRAEQALKRLSVSTTESDAACGSSHARKLQPTPINSYNTFSTLH